MPVSRVTRADPTRYQYSRHMYWAGGHPLCETQYTPIMAGVVLALGS